MLTTAHKISISRRFSAVTLGIMLSLSSGLSQAHTINDAIHSAITTNPDVKGTVTDRAAAVQDVRQAKGVYLPSVDIGAGIGKEYSDNPATRGRPGRHSTFFTRRESDIFIRQLLFDGGATKNTVAQRRYELRSSEYLIGEARERLAFDAADAYLEIMRQKELVEIARQDVNAHKDFLSKINKRLKAGAGRKSELSLVRARLASSEGRLERQKGFLEDAEDTYIRIVGNNPPSHMSQPLLPRIPGSLKAAQDLSVDVNPSVSALKSQYDASGAAVSVAKAAFWPTFNLDIAGTMSDSLDGVPGHNNDALAVIRMDYNIFRGGSDKAAVNAATDRKSTARFNVEDIQRQVNEDIAFSWNQVQTQKSRLPYLRNHRAESLAVFRAYQKQFQLGQRTLFDLLNAETEYFDAKSSVVDSEYDYKSAHYRLLASIGNLTSTLGYNEWDSGIDVVTTLDVPAKTLYDEIVDDVTTPDTAAEKARRVEQYTENETVVNQATLVADNGLAQPFLTASASSPEPRKQAVVNEPKKSFFARLKTPLVNESDLANQPTELAEGGVKTAPVEAKYKQVAARPQAVASNANNNLATESQSPQFAQQTVQPAPVAKPQQALQPMQVAQAKPVAALPKAQPKRVAQKPVTDIQQHDVNHYTLQLLASQSFENLQKFVTDHHLNGMVKYYETTVNGKTWYRLVYGDFDSKKSAWFAMNQMPSELRDLNPMVRTYASVTMPNHNIG